MKINKTTFVVFISLLTLAVNTSVWSQEANSMASQMSNCNNSKSSTWDSARNRCVTKKAEQKTRLESEACNKIEDPKQKADCYLKIAEDKTKLSSKSEDLYQGNYNKSMIMNAVPAAYAVITAINFTASGTSAPKASVGPTDSKLPENMSDNVNADNAAASQEVKTSDVAEKNDKTKSKCLSKAILGTTGMIGIASDLFMKSSAKKKMKSIQKSYALEAGSTSFEAQKTAFDYLKKEQETVLEIAGMEKKRNAALILGYGAAMAMAIYEQFQNNPACKVSTGG